MTPLEAIFEPIEGLMGGLGVAGALMSGEDVIRYDEIWFMNPPSRADICGACAEIYCELVRQL